MAFRATRLAAAVATVVGIVGLKPDRAHSALTIDLRLADAAFTDPKQITAPVAPGQRIPIEVWAVVMGSSADPDAYGFKRAEGSFVSSGTALVGDIVDAGDVEGFGIPAFRRPLVSLAPFNAEASQAGDRVDLDGDGDGDLGAPPGGADGDNSVGGFVVMRAGAMQFNGSLGSQPAPGGGLEFRIGRVEFVVSGFSADEQTAISFVPRQNLDGSINVNAGSWFEVDDAKDAADGVITAGAPIVFVPEPALVGAAALMGTLVLRRRRGCQGEQ